MEQITPNIINVIFRAGRGECQTLSKEATTGERFSELPVARRAGYTFDGWYTSESKDAQRVSAGDLVTAREDITLYARYSKKKGAAAKKKKSTYRLQKKVLFCLLAAIAVLTVSFFVVQYIVSIIPYTDYDGAEYKAKKVDGVYTIFDADGYELETNEDGYYLTKLGTQLKLDPVTGKISVFAVVAVEGIEVAGAGQRVLMFAQIKQANVVSLEVRNQNGSFKIYTDDITSKNKSIFIEGYEDGDYLVSYNPELYAYLCVSAGYPLTLNKLPTDRVLELGYAEVDDMTSEAALAKYDEYATKALNLMKAKNHDYDEAWRSMRISSYTDLILMKIYRTKQIESNEGCTIVSEGVDANYMDMINYSVFGLIKIDFGE
jgi:uncharacterized repeat protein (TIGR02543 family)